MTWTCEGLKRVDANMCVSSNTLRLPPIGFGTADLTGAVDELVLEAIEAGHRLIDTAQVYGSEEGVGRAVSAAVECGLVRRAGIFLSF